MRFTGRWEFNEFMKIYFSAILLFLTANGFCQLTRRAIIDNRIKSIEMSMYDLKGNEDAQVQKKYFYLNGDDSLELHNGVLGFTFKQTVDNKGRTKNLSRLDNKGREDEIHIYKYGKDDSYTIEIIAQGAGTISLKKFNSKHDCIEEIQSSTDTFYYSITKSGQVEKIYQKISGIIKDVAIAEFDSLGFPSTEKFIGEPEICRRRNNKFGLPEEINIYTIDGGDEKLTGRLLFKYEFY